MNCKCSAMRWLYVMMYVVSIQHFYDDGGVGFKRESFPCAPREDCLRRSFANGFAYQAPLICPSRNHPFFKTDLKNDDSRYFCKESRRFFWFRPKLCFSFLFCFSTLGFCWSAWSGGGFGGPGMVLAKGVGLLAEYSFSFRPLGLQYNTIPKTCLIIHYSTTTRKF